MRTVADLLGTYQHVIASLEVVAGSGGVFDVEVDGDLLFSKKADGRHAHDGEVLTLFRERFARDVTPYER